MQPLPVVSQLGTVVWPAIPGGKASQLLALAFQLDASQWLRPAEIQERQFAQLALLVKHAAATVPFYRDRFRRLGLNPARGLQLDDWARLPILTRADVQDAGERLLSTRSPAEHGAKSEWFTSGSTGRPVRVVGTALTGLFWNALTLRDHLWHQRDFAGKLAVIRWLPSERARPPQGERAENWGTATQDVVRTGPSVSLNLQAPPAAQLAWLERENPEYLLTYPSTLRWLLGERPRRGELTKLRQVRTIGESCPDELRALTRVRWEIPLVDLYSTQEAGNVALECPQRPGQYHVQAESVLVEVLDEAGRPAPPGELGRVVLTPLHNFAWPLLRYEVGDWAEPGEACPCGRGLPVLRRIVGRQRNLAVTPDGRRYRPAIVLSGVDDLRADAPIRRFQVIQRAPTKVEVLLEVERPLDHQQVGRLQTEIERAFGTRLDLAVTYLDEIPLGPQGKFEDFRCEIDLPERSQNDSI